MLGIINRGISYKSAELISKLYRSYCRGLEVVPPLAQLIIEITPTQSYCEWLFRLGRIQIGQALGSLLQE